MSVRSSLYYRRGAGGKVAIEDMAVSTGKRLFVHSGTGTDGSAYGFTPDKPLATLDYAVGLCTASKNDIIYLMPGHAESIAGATGALLDIAGVQVIGIGQGTLRPKFTLGTATAATISVTAANVRIRNIAVLSDLADVAAGITLANTADGAIIEDCLFYDTAVDKELKIAISVAAACDGIVIARNQFRSWTAAATGATTEAIALAGESAGSIIIDNFIYGHYVDACIDASTAGATYLQILGNRMVNIDTDAGLAFNGHATTTGVMIGNHCFGTKATVHPIAGVNAMYLSENYANDAVATSAILDPAAGTFAN